MTTAANRTETTYILRGERRKRKNDEDEDESRCGSMPGGGGWEARPDPAAGSKYFIPGLVISFGDPIFITPVRILSTQTFPVAGLWILSTQTLGVVYIT